MHYGVNKIIEYLLLNTYKDDRQRIVVNEIKYFNRLKEIAEAIQRQLINYPHMTFS